MSAYEQRYRILASDTDAFRRLRLSRLFTLLQEAAIAHTTALGFGREKTLDRGLLWVITLQHAKIARLPLYDEDVVLRSVPGEMQHFFYPRAYLLTDAAGNELVSAAALWALMDADSRKMVHPDASGVVIAGEAPFWETFSPRPPKLPQEPETAPFTVPYSYVDLNGHMNNTRYFDLAEDLMPPALAAMSAREIMTEYTGEAKCGETIALSYRAQQDRFALSGAAGKRLFRLSIAYSD